MDLHLRLTPALIVLLVVVFGARRAHAVECVDAFDQGQESRAAAALTRAAEELAICADAACPKPIRDKCVQWLGEVERALPTVVLAAKDDGGGDVDARVSLRALDSDEPAAEASIDGRALPLDPGRYELSFEAVDRSPVTLTIVVKAGEKNRLVVARFPAPPEPVVEPPPPPPPVAPAPPPVAPTPTPAPLAQPAPDSGTLPPWVYVGFGVGGAALIVAVVTTAVAVSKFDDVEARCASEPGCSGDDIAEGENIAHVATVSYILSGVALGAAVIGVIVASSEPNAVTWMLGPGSLAIRGRF